MLDEFAPDRVLVDKVEQADVAIVWVEAEADHRHAIGPVLGDGAFEGVPHPRQFGGVQHAMDDADAGFGQVALSRRQGVRVDRVPGHVSSVVLLLVVVRA